MERMSPKRQQIQPSPAIPPKTTPGSGEWGRLPPDEQCFGVKRAIPILGGCTWACSVPSIPLPGQQQGTRALLQPICFGTDSNSCHGAS